jgi:hypothetical protein
MLTSVGLYFVKRLTRTVVLFLVGNNVEVIEFPLLYILSYFTPSVKVFRADIQPNYPVECLCFHFNFWYHALLVIIQYWFAAKCWNSSIAELSCLFVLRQN